jgi:hypothetical protein
MFVAFFVHAWPVCGCNLFLLIVLFLLLPFLTHARTLPFLAPTHVLGWSLDPERHPDSVGFDLRDKYRTVDLSEDKTDLEPEELVASAGASVNLLYLLSHYF